ncbi:MAG: hypothetical protein U0326_21340 [Polyangiales bacterium]
MDALRDTVFHVALLAGLGRSALPLATAVADRVRGVSARGRSCLDVGEALQFTSLAPSADALEIGFRASADRTPPRPVEHVFTAAQADALRPRLAALAAADAPWEHPLGTWLFTDASGLRACVDVRGGAPRDALVRALGVSGAHGRDASRATESLLGAAQPWTLSLPADPEPSATLYWLLHRDRDPARTLADAGFADAWRVLEPTLRALLGRVPDAWAGPWVFGLPTGASSDVLSLASAGWSLLPDDERKRAPWLEAVAAVNGDVSRADALWSLLVGGAPSSHRRVGRAVELTLTREGAVRLRAYFVPRLTEPSRPPGSLAPTT